MPRKGDNMLIKRSEIMRQTFIDKIKPLLESYLDISKPDDDYIEIDLTNGYHIEILLLKPLKNNN
jgi:hypothetical protein